LATSLSSLASFSRVGGALVFLRQRCELRIAAAVEHLARLGVAKQLADELGVIGIHGRRRLVGGDRLPEQLDALADRGADLAVPHAHDHLRRVAADEHDQGGPLAVADFELVLHLELDVVRRLDRAVLVDVH
jgi:hypothetical protein